ncbi:aldose epimerase [Caldibacillus lycopersici]|uniref:Aldose epimerase n=1 Tax=Perspicuibacillus lycopersici TaxID=1325689 RepID=A0AAE3IR78_9BACI|nr:aldose epimerase [Perspicuibacillus lycopersici]MCU9613100.1 aldose epimerase [Perspicuibacillus lycopersici]
MYSINSYDEQSLKFYQVSNPEKTTWFTVCPERGGIITEFAVAGEQMLYLNKETLFDFEKNVRGGIPILFPISGQLENGSYEWEGTTYQMPNHGVARINPWEVVETNADENEAAITIRLTSNEQMKEVYPFAFTVEFTYTLRENQLQINQVFRNDSDKYMPIYAGLHPYFSAKSKVVAIDSKARTYFDYNMFEAKPFSGELNMEGLKEAVVLDDEDVAKLSFQMGDEKRIVMETSPEYRYTVVWTEAGKDFVCVEPWMAKTEELNRKTELVLIDPKKELHSFVSFSVE